MSEPLISAALLNVSLGRKVILHALSFYIEGGGVVGLVGPNGSGKTTLLRTIGGLLEYEGQLSVEGREVSSWPAADLARRIAFVRQTAVLSFEFTVEEFVGLGRTPHKRWLERDTPDDRAHVHAVMEELDLVAFSDTAVTRLSGGEQQRLFLAQALVQDTGILLLDEPTLHLDLYHQYDLMRRLRALVAQGKTVIAVVHDLELAARYADRLMVLRDGRLVAQGPPAEIVTPALIQDVFHLDADVTQANDRSISIHFKPP